MKNLKRALSLVLTMAMLLGMFLVPTNAASTFTDADLIENTEAVQITSGIGLFAGTSDGQFAPKAAVTRAQMATIIVKMLRGNDFNADAFKGAGVNPFPDTAAFEGGWAEGYINACSQLGVVAGYGDGTFQPGKAVTTAEALTMIINALGVDPGPGEWPMTYMAKAEEMKLYGDLAVKPGTNNPLTRDQLAVIVWEGLKYSPSGSTGYSYTVGGKTFTFETLAEAIDAIGVANIGAVNEVIGEDSLASKVYELKNTTGWITGNAATGEDCTVLTLANDSTEEYGIETGLDMLGHYVTVYYKEQFKNEEDPGVAYTIVDESTVVTVKEAISTAKKYKEAFGKSIEIAADGFTFDDSYGVSDGVSIAGYTAGSAAPKGTYIIADGAIVTYIEPAAVYASYVSSISTVDGNEQVYLNGVAVPNTEGDDLVVEYEGMKSGDYVTYVKVGGIYVLSPVKKVSGTVTKTSTTEVNGEDYDAITLDGTLYPAFEPKNTINSNNLVGVKLNNNLSNLEYGQNYTLYVTEDGHYIGFESDGAAVSLDNTVFLLGSILIKEKDQYGKVAYLNKARGVDTAGKEVMITIGKAVESNDTEGYQDGEDVDALGTMYTLDTKGFYTVKDSTDKDEKKEGVQVVTAWQEAATSENPTYASRTYIAQTNWTGSSSIVVANGTHAYNKNSSVFIILEGEITDSEPLTATVHTGTMSPGVDLVYGENSGYMLLTLNNIQSDIEVFVQLVAEKILETKYVYLTQDQVDARARTAEGYAYNVYDLSTGGEIEVILDEEATLITQPGYVKLTVMEDDLYTADSTSMNVDLVDVITDSSKNQSTDDITVFISDAAFLGITASRMRFQRAASTDGNRKAIDGYDNVGYNNSNASGATVVDLRTDEEILASGVGEITGLTQLNTLTSNDPGLVAIMDIGMVGHYRSHSLKNIFIKRVVRDTVGLNSILWLGDDAFGSDRNGDYATGMIVSSKTAAMGETKKVYVDEVMDFGTGFYRYMVDADGYIKLVPVDNTNVGTFQGNIGVYAAHNEIASAEAVNGKVFITTNDQNHDCDFGCTNADFEARKDVYLTADTRIYDATTGRWMEVEDIDLEAMLNSGIVNVDYYCEGAIKSVAADRLTEKDSTAELLIITGKTEYPHSCDGNHEGWTAIAADSAKFTISESGNYYLTEDVTRQIVVNSGVTAKLCLCGHSITTNLVTLTVNGNLELVNCVGKEGGNITSTGTTSQTVQINSGAVLTMQDGVHMVDSVNRAVMLINGGTFNMEGGNISNNTSRDYGAIWLNSGAFNMNGGTISGNTAAGTGSMTNKGCGGAVYQNGGTFTMNGGTISGTATGNGGGVFMHKGTFTMNDGTISGCSAAAGAGVYVHTGTFNMKGGTIKDNAKVNGGGVYVNHGGSSTASTALNMTGGTIAGSGNLVYIISSGVTASAMSGGTVNGAIITSGTGNNPENKTQLILSGDITVTGKIDSYGTTTISGGRYQGTVSDKDSANAGRDVTITGGTFSVDPSGLLKAGYVATKTGNVWVVTAE